MDHHCPWINNCVGEWNQKYFLQFLIYVGLLSAYAVSLVVFSWIRQCTDCHQDQLVTQTRMSVDPTHNTRKASLSGLDKHL